MEPWDHWEPGYVERELRAAEERLGFRFPPDVLAFLLRRRIPGGYDWTGDDVAVREMLARPLEGLLFDVEENALWWPEWGAKPLAALDRAAVVAAVVARAPRLIPLYSHRYIPEEPREAGSPVFSVVQSDIIYYGADLADYLRNEFAARPPIAPTAAAKHIPFWSTMAERW